MHQQPTAIFESCGRALKVTVWTIALALLLSASSIMSITVIFSSVTENFVLRIIEDLFSGDSTGNVLTNNAVIIFARMVLRICPP